jgi:hypothetical protein
MKTEHGKKFAEYDKKYAEYCEKYAEKEICSISNKM